MKNSVKIVSLSVATTLLLSSTAMALPDNSIVMGNTAFSTDALFNGVEGIQAALDAAGDDLYYNLEGSTNGFVELFNSDKAMSQEAKNAMKNFEYVNADGTKEAWATFEHKIVEGLAVESVTVTSKTTVTVKLESIPSEEPTLDDFTVSGATATGIAKGEADDEYVLTVNSLDDKEGTVTVNGVSGTYDYKDDDSNNDGAAVEKIEFVNYRNIKVTFNTIVDKASAQDASNYYMEIVDGNAQYGFLPTLQSSNQLSKIETEYVYGADGWWNGVIQGGVEIAPRHIIASEADGKTVVNIYLPEDARFTNVKDANLGVYPDPYIASPFKYSEDDERTLTIKQKNSKTDGFIKKLLIKNTSVNVGVRNVKDASGKFTVDTVDMPIKIFDTVKPELVGYRIIDNPKQVDDPCNYSGLQRDLGSFDLLRNGKQAGEKLQFIYSEPVFDAHGFDKSDLEFYRDVQLYVNGKKVASLFECNLDDYMHFEMDKDSTYTGSQTVTIDAEAAVKAAFPEVFTTGIDYEIRFVGVTDLAGNLEVSSEHSFKVRFHDDPVPGAVMPVVKGIEQVADNMFRVEFNRAEAQGTLVIHNPDGNGFGTLEMPFGKSEEASNGKFYSYVTVPARDHEPNDAVPTGIEQNQILAYDGQNTIYRNIRIEDVRVEDDSYTGGDLDGDDKAIDNMKLVNDILAPVAIDPEDREYDDRDPIIRIAVKDIIPWMDKDGDKIDEDIDYEYAVRPVAYKYNPAEKRFENEISTNQIGSDNYLPIKVSYVDADGAKHVALISNEDLRPYWFWGAEFGDLNQGYDDAITYEAVTDILTLDLSHYPELLDRKNNGKLVAGATYTVEIQPGYFTDAPKDTHFTYAGNDFKGLDILAVDDGRDADNYRGRFKTDSGLGYTSAKDTLSFDVETAPPAEEYVPQTSKQLISYDEPTDSMRIEFTGTIDVDTLKDKDNYSFDGKTLTEWDELLGTDTVIDYEVDNSRPNDVRQYAVFKIPQDSIKEFGDYNFTVSDVAHPNGAKMTPVSTVVRLEDNFRPVVIDAVVTGDSQIKLTFNEAIKYFVDPAEGADPISLVNNFVVMVDGQQWFFDSAVIASPSDNDREIILTGNQLPEGDITVEIVKDQNDNILVIDQSPNRNPLKEDVYEVTRP